jgi:hypothetical protein
MRSLKASSAVIDGEAIFAFLNRLDEERSFAELWVLVERG